MKKITFLLTTTLFLGAEALSAMQIQEIDGSENSRENRISQFDESKSENTIFQIARQADIDLSDKQFFSPEGEHHTYVMECRYMTEMGEMILSNVKAQICFGANDTIFFKNLPTMLGEDGSWAYGIKDEQDVITMPSGQLIHVFGNDMSTGAVYLSGAVTNDVDMIIELLENYQMKIDETNKHITSLHNDNYLATHTAENGIYALNGDFILLPFDKEPVTPPADLALQTYRLDYYFIGYPKSKVVEVGFTDNKIYIKGLTLRMKDCWVEGTLENNLVKIPGAQYLGDYKNCIIEFMPGQFNAMGMVPIENLIFTMDQDRKTLTSLEDVVLFEMFSSDNYISYIENPQLYHYNEVAATPKKPYNLDFFASDWGHILSFITPLEDIDGNFINPDLESLKLYVDDKEYVFSTEIYPYLMIPLQEIPYDCNYNDFYQEFAG